MTLILFIDDENGFLAWVRANPNGYVANMDKAGNIPNYPLVHLARHKSISSPSRKNYTTGKYLKACSENLRELEKWSRDRYRRPLRWCEPCEVLKSTLESKHLKASAAGETWSEEELRSSVFAYLEMLGFSRREQPFTKKRYYEKLGKLHGRTAKSYEYRMQNISYVLALMGRSWIPGLPPKKNIGAENAAIVEKLIGEIEGRPTAPMAAFAIEIQDAGRRLRDPPKGNTSPKSATANVTRYQRDIAVVAWVLRQAKGVCECCRKPAPFESSTGAYLEVHHVRQLAEGGPDTICNAVAICPNCHRELHYGLESKKIIAGMLGRISRLKKIKR